MASKSTKTIYRSSVTGRIVTPLYAVMHPSTTEKEQVRVPSSGSKK